MREDGLTASSPFGAAASVTIRRQLERMMQCLPGTIDGQDIEALHDMRVASRRLRAALRVFKRCFPPDGPKSVVSQVGSVTRALGQVRDQDVLLDFLADYSDGCAPEMRVDWVIDRERQIREGARIQMLDSLVALKQSDLPAEVSHLLAQLESGDGRGRSAFAGHALRVTKRPLSKLARLAPAIRDPEKVEELHLARIAAKRLRYTLETFLPCFGEPLRERISQVKRLQELLGEVHDSDVWLEKLQAYRNEPGLSEDRLGALERLIEDRTAFRRRSYRDAVRHWNGLESEGFLDGLIRLVESPQRTHMDGRKEGSKVGETVKKKIAAQSETEQPEWGVTGQGTRRKIREVSTPADSDGGLAAQVSASVASAQSRLGEGCAKLGKQLAKSKSVLDSVTSNPRDLGGDDIAKLTKWLGKLDELAGQVPEGGDMPAKEAEKLRDKMRSLRRKISALVEKHSG